MFRLIKRALKRFLLSQILSTIRSVLLAQGSKIIYFVLFINVTDHLTLVMLVSLAALFLCLILLSVFMYKRRKQGIDILLYFRIHLAKDYN